VDGIAPNTHLSHYKILSKLGAGGMGEVYLAQDTSALGRTVALKLLSAEVASHKDRLQRFTQEARTVSNLNHPNILTVYEFGQTESTSFIATEYIDGLTLRQHLTGGRAKLSELLDLAIQIVGALNAAHEAGVAHRDLKPENVMVRKDHIVKVLDFGLAKLSEPESPASGPIGTEDATLLQVNTRPGVVMGTVSYMSPEQSVGKDIDQRTDIWSFGVVLYEMIAGCLPFPGSDIHRQIIAIQEAEPSPLSQHVNGVPERLEEIIDKCLAKDKNERYQTAKDLLIDLRNLRRKLDVDAEIERTVAPALRSASAANSASPATSPVATAPTTSSAEYIVAGIKQHKLAAIVAVVVILLAAVGVTAYFRTRSGGTAIQSIAVMPFVNEGGNADVEYLSDGMTETLISSLSQIPNLNVKARSLVFRYKGKDTNPQTIGRDLNVQAVLNGRLVQRGSDLIVYLELVDASTGNLIWGDSYNRQQSDLVSLQTDLARDVSSKLRMKLSGAEEQRMMKNYTANSDAYRLFLRGKFLSNKRTPRDSQAAIDNFQQAVSLDPQFAMAYAGLATGYTYLAIYGYSPAKEVFPKAREYAAKALEIDSSLSDPHMSLGMMAFLWDHDMATWERENRRALELNPNSTDIHRIEATRLLILGKSAEAIAEVRRALDIEPLSIAGNMTYGYCMFYSGQIDEGRAHLRKTIELSPEFWMSYYYQSAVFRNERKFPEAAEAMAKSKEYWGEPEAAKLIRETFAKKGWQGLLRTICAQPQQFKFWQYDLATFYAELGDKENAFARLNQSLEDHEYFIGFMTVDPFLNSLRDDPRFIEITKKVGLPH
jgi:eukaryotic-like serine/threonine-protein kinase